MAARSAHSADPVARAATARDLDAVVAIEGASFADPWSRDAFEHALTGAGVRFDVACDAAGAVIGYARFGFREIGRRRAYYRKPTEDALVLSLDLGAEP